MKNRALADASLKENQMKNCFFLYPHIDFKKYNKYVDDISEREYITFVNPTRTKGGDVVEMLARKYPNKKFMIVKGGYYPHLQEFARYKKLTNCHIVDNTNDIIKNVYSKTKILLAPSRYETFGMCAAEVQAMGIPCISNIHFGGLI